MYIDFFLQFRSVQSLSRVWLFATPWILVCQASLSITNSQNSPKLTSIESVMPSGHLILCRPLLLLPSIPPNIRVFSNESTLRMRWPKYWSFSFSIILSKEHPGLISFRMDWLDLLVVQGILKSLLQHHSSKASILWRSAFFTVQFSQTALLRYVRHCKRNSSNTRLWNEVWGCSCQLLEERLVRQVWRVAEKCMFNYQLFYFSYIPSFIVIQQNLFPCDKIKSFTHFLGTLLLEIFWLLA